MNKFLSYSCLSLGLLSFISCFDSAKQEPKDAFIIGTWELTGWNIDGRFDFDKNGKASSNLLNEINCAQSETLVFDKDGVVSLNKTFNPEIEIALLKDSLHKNAYRCKITCDNEGSISFATSYNVNEARIMIGESEAQFQNNQIHLLLKDQIKIYNEKFTKLIEAKDLTLVYSKQ